MSTDLSFIDDTQLEVVDGGEFFTACFIAGLAAGAAFATAVYCVNLAKPNVVASGDFSSGAC